MSIFNLRLQFQIRIWTKGTPLLTQKFKQGINTRNAYVLEVPLTTSTPQHWQNNFRILHGLVTHHKKDIPGNIKEKSYEFLTITAPLFLNFYGLNKSSFLIL
jgi:hypothetical protein